MTDRSEPKDTPSQYHVESRLIHGEMQSRHWNYNDHIVPPMSASAAYRLNSTSRGAEGFQQFANPELERPESGPVYIYDRLEEPSRAMLEDNLATAEGGECCVAFATGMAAIAASLGVLLKAGDRVIAHKTIYGCTYSLLTNWFPRLGIEVTFTDLTDLAELERLLEAHPETKAVYGETPSNPTLELLDLGGITSRVVAHNEAHGLGVRGQGRRVFTIVDNTFSTPFCQRPLEHGIDLVVHSLTKNLGGFGTDMGGAVIGPKLLEPDLLLYRKDFGGALSPKAAWPALVYGLPTLALRMRQQMTTAQEIAQFLERHEQIARVDYPGLESFPQHELAKLQMRDFEGRFAPGTLLYFHLHGSPTEAKVRGARLMDRLADDALTVTLAVSLGQIRTLIEHPASMTHSTVPAEKQAAAGLDPGGIRLSIGLEPATDIIADLERAFQHLEATAKTAAPELVEVT